MPTEIFRFVAIRPPKPASSTAPDRAVNLGGDGSDLIGLLRRERAEGSLAGMVRVASAYATSPIFLASAAKLDVPMRSFIGSLQRLAGSGFRSAALHAFSTAFGQAPDAYVASQAFTDLLRIASDSLVAVTIVPANDSRPAAFLARLARTLWLILRVADGSAVTRAGFLEAPIVLPPGIFPLPLPADDLKDRRKAAADAAAAARNARAKAVAALDADLEARLAARDEILAAFERSGAQPLPVRTAAPAASASVTPSGFVLTEAAAENLSAATKATLEAVGVPATRVDVAKSVNLLEKSAAALTGKLYAGTGGSRQMVRIGSRLFPSDALSGGLVAVGPGFDLRTPGPCAPVLNTDPPPDDPTVPTGKGDAHVLGMADLLVVEQDLLRYQLGEIAHVENVLKSEVRSRKFKTVDTTQQTLTTQTETTTEKEQDLSSDERFQLQTEAQTVISETSGKQAGVTIHASYGPSVDATANYGTSSSTSTQQSNASSSSYAREVTTKAVERVQTRTLTSRTITTINVVEEVNRHAFDNKDGAADIVGIYRYLDKIYRAQVVNYGKRLMLEFIVPEPAAFLRYAMTHRPADGVTLTEPDPPGYCVAGQSFEELQASDITPDNYLYWASKYGAQDVTTPPPSVVIASGVKKAPDQMPTVGDRLLSSDTFDIAIPDGYLTQSAFVNIYGETQDGDHRIFYQLQEQQGEYMEPWDDQLTWALHLTPTPTLTVTVNSIGFHNYEVLVTVFCSRSTEKLQDWQLKTFASIMNAYHDLKSAYDQAVAEARLRAEDSGTIQGTNPDANRIVEQTELKKGCISLLTAQRFDLFDAVARNVAPLGYPEIDFAEAKAEGSYISFFEQSFEWNNMVYLFYPYFWGKKDDWATIVGITDNDPLFAQFLQAGAARVKVPVRPGFNDAIQTFLNTAKLPASDAVMVGADNDGPDPTQLSIIDELKSQLGDNNVDGVGLVTASQNATAVKGSGTVFTEDDEDRRIVIGGITSVIKTVKEEDQTLTLRDPYPGPSAEAVGYALGGVLVGQPWEVKLPTNLVKLDSSLVIT